MSFLDICGLFCISSLLFVSLFALIFVFALKLLINTENKQQTNPCIVICLFMLDFGVVNTNELAKFIIFSILCDEVGE